MSNAKEDPRKRLREELHEIEDELKKSNHMYRIAAEKNPVKSKLLCIFSVGRHENPAKEPHPSSLFCFLSLFDFTVKPWLKGH